MALLLRFRRRRANSGCDGRSFVDLVEADLLGIGCGRKQSDRTGNEGKAQEPLPIGAGCHEILLTKQKLRIQNSLAGIVPTFKTKGAPLRHSLAIRSLLVLVENDHCLNAGDRVS